MKYDYNFTNLNIEILDKDIKAIFGAKYLYLSALGTNVSFYFTELLNETEYAQFDAAIISHDANISSSFDYQLAMAQTSQDENISFARDLLSTWIRKNTLEGMSIPQSLWVFSRFETFNVPTPNGNWRVDLFKMFNTGALPTLYYCMLRIQPDDMTQTYHWLTQTRLDWVKTKIEERLGSGMINYINSLP